jgi:hypothetical protein
MNNMFDKNIKNYSISELFSIIGLDIESSEDAIIEKTNNYIYTFRNDPEITLFFKQIQNKLLYFINEEDVETPTENWETNTGLLEQPDKTQASKITDRKQKVDVYSDKHMPMKQDQLGINNTYNVPVAQDTLNPKLENTIERFINIDSQFRQSSNNYENSSSDYVLDLSESLSNVLSLRLYSYQIPYSWYCIDSKYGNNCFWITIFDAMNTPIVVNIEFPDGNYTVDEFVNKLSLLIKAEFDFTGLPEPVDYNSNTGKITLKFFDAIYIKNTAIKVSETSIITFFDQYANLQCKSKCVNKTFYINQSFGWLMGFRIPYMNVSSGGNTAISLLNLTGTKYLILVIDDYNQNHINNGLVSIAEFSKTLKLPTYYSSDLNHSCSEPTQDTSTIDLIIQENIDNPDIGLLIADKMNTQYTQLEQILPNNPRTLTQSQIYTINEIIKNNENLTNYRFKAPTNTDVFSIIPIKTKSLATGDLIVELTGPLQDNKRTYFGPVNVDRMRVSLYDDKGNILNLNGADWGFTIIATLLYQY